MKSIWVFVLSAATVTAYFHVRHHEPVVVPVKHESVPVPSEPSPKPAGDIVVAPYAGGSVGSRWDGASPVPASVDPGKNH